MSETEAVIAMRIGDIASELHKLNQQLLAINSTLQNINHKLK